jgi:hypothetical protein
LTTLEVRTRFARDQGLPFAESLSQASILEVLNEHKVEYRDRLFNEVLSRVVDEDFIRRRPLPLS